MATIASAPEVNVFAFRKSARRKAWVCPGAGFAYIGRPVLAVLCYLASVGSFLAAVVTAFSPSRLALTATIALIVVGTLLWLFELFSTYTAWPDPNRARLALNPWLGALVIWVVVALFAVVAMNSFQLIAFGGAFMSPTIADDETLLFHRSVDDERLRRGTVILFETDGDNKIMEAGTLMIGRIIAVPGDVISISDARYVVNGTIEQHVAPSDTLPLAINVPKEPKLLKLPADCYFVSQDSRNSGLDSRVLGYAKRERIVSTKMFRFGKSPFLQTIE